MIEWIGWDKESFTKIAGTYFGSKRKTRNWFNVEGKPAGSPSVVNILFE